MAHTGDDTTPATDPTERLSPEHFLTGEAPTRRLRRGTGGAGRLSETDDTVRAPQLDPAVIYDRLQAALVDVDAPYVDARRVPTDVAAVLATVLERLKALEAKLDAQQAGQTGPCGG